MGRHGRLRGWAKTGADGRYRFDTIKPAPYPRGEIPAHVHLMIGEPGRRTYYIDDVVFDGEFGVTKAPGEKVESPVFRNPARPPKYWSIGRFLFNARGSKRYRKAQELRGGSGIVRLSRDDKGVGLARRDIVLERHPD